MKLETEILKILEANDGLCMDVPKERARLKRALVKALGGPKKPSDSFKYLVTLVNCGMLAEIRNCSTKKEAMALAGKIAKENGHTLEEINSTAEYEVAIWEKSKDGKEYEKFHGLL